MIFITNYFACGESEAQVFLNHFKSSPNLKPFTANPLLLSILCFATHKNSHRSSSFQLPERQAEILNKVIDKFLDRPSNIPVPGKILRRNLNSKEFKLNLLERLAFDLQCSNIPPGKPMPDELLLKSIQNSLSFYDVNNEKTNHMLARFILDDLDNKDGLLIQEKSDTSHHSFIHRSVQQYLAAKYLAKFIQGGESRDWKRPVPLLSGNQKSTQELIDWFSWQIEQQETVVFLAGLLNDPYSLLRILANPDNDDKFMHRRALAVLCLLEIDRTRMSSDRIVHLRDNLANEILETWFDPRRPNTEENEDYLQNAVIALEKLNPGFRNQPFDDYLSGQIANPDPKTRKMLPITLKLINSSPISTKLTKGIRTLLSQKQVIGVDFVGILGSTAAKQEILELLIGFLDMPQNQEKVLRALREMGKAAAHPEIINKISSLFALEIQNGFSSDIGILILETIRYLGIGQNEKILPQLNIIINNSNLYAAYLRSNAAYALAETDLGLLNDYDRERFFQEITVLLSEEEQSEKARKAISRALQNTHDSSIRKQIIDYFAKTNHSSQNIDKLVIATVFSTEEFMKILQCEEDEDGNLDGTYSAVQVEKLGKEKLEIAAGSVEIINELISWLKSNNVNLQLNAKRIFSKLANECPEAWTAAKLADVYATSQNAKTRSLAAEILCEYRKFAAQPAILRKFSIRLKNKNEDLVVITNTARALQNIGFPATAESSLLKQIIDSLTFRLKHAEKEKDSSYIQEVSLALAYMIGEGVQKSVSQEYLDEPIHGLISNLIRNNNFEFSEEIKILHRFGLRFFIGENSVIQAKTIKELCNNL